MAATEAQAATAAEVEIKRIGVMTSGGDCPGLNAAIRSVIAHATLRYRWEVVGIQYATHGLAQRMAVPLCAETVDFSGVDPLLYTGGTVLRSINKYYPEDTPEMMDAGYRELGLDALIVIGGDGSQAIIRGYAAQFGWRHVGIPKTIDNDVPLTKRSIGFDSSVNTITDALHRLSFTAASHDRVMVVEVMGRTAGHLALHAGVASGADVILIPEIPYTMSRVVKRLKKVTEVLGRRWALVVVAEGVKPEEEGGCELVDCRGQTVKRGVGEYFADALKRAGLDTRCTVLGHTQRGGVPTATDRILATAFGIEAVECLARGQQDVMVAWANSQVEVVQLQDVVTARTAHVLPTSFMVKTAVGTGTYVGDVPRE